MSKFSDVAEYINAAKSIALVCHINPDGDTLGSANALRLALGDRAQIICDDGIPAKIYSFKYTEVQYQQRIRP